MRICPKCLQPCYHFTPRGICTDCYDKDSEWKKPRHVEPDIDPSWIDLKKKWDSKLH